jgi:DNA invertase Pin-like site-specific DNA recombinase
MLVVPGETTGRPRHQLTAAAIRRKQKPGNVCAIADRKAGFRSLGDAWADTTTSHGRLMLTVLGGLAEFERELIRIRTGEGRARAKENGISLGRKPKLTPHQKQEAIRRRDEGQSVRAIARSYNVSPSTISRLTA